MAGESFLTLPATRWGSPAHRLDHRTVAFDGFGVSVRLPTRAHQLGDTPKRHARYTDRHQYSVDQVVTKVTPQHGQNKQAAARYEGIDDLVRPEINDEQEHEHDGQQCKNDVNQQASHDRLRSDCIYTLMPIARDIHIILHSAIFVNTLSILTKIFPNKKAPGKGGHHLAPFYPLTHPGGKRNGLDQIADVRWLKGLVYTQCLMLPKWRVVTWGNALRIT